MMNRHMKLWWPTLLWGSTVGAWSVGCVTPEVEPSIVPAVDADGDGVDAETDCNDDNATIYPGATEIPYDGIDQDCSGKDLIDVDGDGYELTEDCDDTNYNISPGADDSLVDGLDSNCNGRDAQLSVVMSTSRALGGYFPAQGISAVALGTINDKEILYAYDPNRCVVWRRNPDGQIDVAAGTLDTCSYGGDGGLAINAGINYGYDLATSPKGTSHYLYILDSGNARIRRVASDGKIQTVAGNGTIDTYGDGGLATAAALYYPYYMGVVTLQNGSDSLYVTESGAGALRRIGPDGRINTVAGSRDDYSPTLCDGCYAPDVKLESLQDVVPFLTTEGEAVYFISKNYSQIWSMNPSQYLSLTAGSGTQGYSGDGELAKATSLNIPQGLALDTLSKPTRIYLTDTYNLRVRVVNPDGRVYNIAGDGGNGEPSEGDALDTSIGYPYMLAVSETGAIYFSFYTQSGVFGVARLTAD